MICPNCGAENDDNAKICSLCECELELVSEFENAEMKDNNEQSHAIENIESVKEKKPAVTVVIILLIAIVVILVGLYLYLSFSESGSTNKKVPGSYAQNETTAGRTEHTTDDEIISKTAVAEADATEITEENTEEATMSDASSNAENKESDESEDVSDKTESRHKQQYYINELKQMTGIELAELCGNNYNSNISQYEGKAYEFSSPSVLPGYRIYFEYDGGEKFVPDDKLPVMVVVDFGNATENTWLGMKYSEFIENNGIPDQINWDNMDGDGFSIIYTEGDTVINYKFQTDFEVFDYLSGLTGEYTEFIVDDEINNYLLEQDPCVAEIWCK